MNVKSSLKKIIPNFLIILRRKIIAIFYKQYEKRQIPKIRKSQDLILEVIKKKEKVNVIFLVVHDSVWKYDEVYRLLDNDSKFNVKVAVIPLVRNGEGQMETYYQTLDYFQTKKYNTIASFDKKNNCWLDIKLLTNPDIVFFTNPHRLTYNKYYIHNFTDTLTCYVPYAFVVIHAIEIHYNQFIHHVLWKYFLETNEHKNLAAKFIGNNANNLIVTGFPGLDKKYNKSYKIKEVWKKHTSKKKLIWAPHHTISGQGSGLDYSSFMEYANYFIELLNIRDDIQIAFKPHPLLKEKLYKDEFWGIKKTDDYYKLWERLPNGQLEKGDYFDLFLKSDAMIMDSASFIVEYLYFDKPILFTMIDDSVIERFNSFGKQVFNYLYKGKDKEDINEFINNKLMKGNDELRIGRNQFLKDKILPKNDKTASENIYNILKNELC